MKSETVPALIGPSQIVPPSHRVLQWNCAIQVPNQLCSEIPEAQSKETLSESGLELPNPVFAQFKTLFMNDVSYVHCLYYRCSTDINRSLIWILVLAKLGQENIGKSWFTMSQDNFNCDESYTLLKKTNKRTFLCHQIPTEWNFFVADSKSTMGRTLK